MRYADIIEHRAQLFTGGPRMLPYVGVAILLLLHVAALGQTQGNAPQVTDSFLSANQMNGGTGACSPGSGTCVNFTEGSTAQDLIVCAASSQDVTTCVGGSNSGWTFQDSLGANLTMLTMGNNGGTPGTSTNFYSRVGYTCDTTTQASYQVNWTSGAPTSGCIASFECQRVKNVCSAGSVTLDASIVTNNATGATGVNTVTNTITTTNLNDFVFSMGQKAAGNGGSNREQSINQLAQMTYDGNLGTAWQIAPVLGSNSFSWSDVDAASNNTFAQTQAFKVPQNLGDSALPQAAIGTAYSAQLHAYGGVSASPTFACTGLPASGLSLNTATGLISGTPTGSATTLSLSCTFNDGVNTSPADALSLKIGAGFQSPSLIGTPQVVNFGNGGGSVTVSGVNCGDVITLQAVMADDTHGGTGYKQVINGVGNSVSSTDGSPVQEYFLNTGGFSGPTVVWVVGPMLSGGTKTISVFNSTTSASGLAVLVSDWSGVQAALDQPSVNTTIATTNTASVSTSYTTVVPNELVNVVASSGYVRNAASVASMSINAPFISDGSAGATFTFYQFGHEIVSSPSTVTPTVNVTETNWGCNTFAICDTTTIMATALRPALTSVCAPPVGPGEKIRRVIF